jgi:pimeloyl-ACP methyl ester carboxylesterase
MRTLLLAALLAPTLARGAAPVDYAMPQRLVAIDGARRLNLFCLGEGKPTVLFIQGLGSPMSDWRRVMDPVSATTRACAYDRAGMGRSDPMNKPADITNSVDDLHRLITAAKIPTPVILVPHSIGGDIAELYAATYPDDVAGMVMVDPSFPDQVAIGTATWTPAEKAKFKALIGPAGLAPVYKCLDQARRGELLKPENEKSQCLDNPNPEPDAALHRALNAEYAQPKVYLAILSEIQTSDAADDAKESVDDAEVKARPLHFGNKPLVVLTAANGEPTPEFTPHMTASYHAGWKQGHDALAATSTRGVSIVVPKSGHFIAKDAPDVVTRYIQDVVGQVRAAKPEQAKAPTP